MRAKNILKNNSGFTLVAVIFTIVIFLMLVLLGYNLAISDRRISMGQLGSVQAYYVAEAGVRNTLWKLQNDTSWNSSFKAGTLNNQQLNFGSVVMDTSSISVTVNSVAPGVAQITSTGYKQTNKGTAKRVVQVKASTATGGNLPDALNSVGLFSSGGITVNGSSNTTIVGAGTFTNNNMTVNIGQPKKVTMDGAAMAVGRITDNTGALVATGGKQSSNFPPAPASRQTPSIDFDSSNPTSYKNMATIVYTSQQFSNLLFNNHNVNLPGPITYVDGGVILNGSNINFTVTGLLVTSGQIIVNGSNITFTVNSVPNGPSGVLSKNQIIFNGSQSNTNINGVVYSMGQFIMNGSSSYQFNVNGAIVSDGRFTNNGNIDLKVTYTQSVITSVFSQGSSTSPTIETDHWEEAY